mmetsp:Transcript_17547/g.29415  ORF Transcript_17547/g.29415 Transcript_17547/m.29415 type:complete len:181 (+) Transcript_17547:30-572(+)
MLRSASFLLRAGVFSPNVSYRAPSGNSGVIMATRLLSAKKNKAKKAKKAKKGEPEDNDKEDEWIANLIDTAEAVRKSKHPFTPEEQEEHKRIGREYNRQRMIQDNMFKKDLSTKIWMQQDAMNALPEALRKAAAEIDETPPPEDRPFPIFLTPPVPGLNLKDESKEDDEDPDFEAPESEY